ncbi:MAG: hypothetical protein CSA45_03055 [Gammaproteobacteria bacterium]|nr:MAG: hypothetical protein CSA45_03055 [Gammaproteobacteria bacterium]
MVGIISKRKRHAIKKPTIQSVQMRLMSILEKRGHYNVKKHYPQKRALPEDFDYPYQGTGGYQSTINRLI